MPITDLTGTTWVIPSGWKSTAGYGRFNIKGTVTGHIYVNERFSTFDVGYYITSLLDNSLTFTDVVATLDTAVSFSMTITGGTDVSNPRLIEWLLITCKPETAPTSIKYKNIEIASIETGQSVTLVCNEKFMSGDVVITFGEEGYITYKGIETKGSNGQVATLTCDGKIMRSDVAVRGKNYYLAANELGTTVVIVSHEEENDHIGTTVII